MDEGMSRWCSIVAIVVGIAAAPSSAAAKGAAGSCGCSDVNDLINRIALAHAAQEKFRAEIPAIQSASKTKPVTYDGTAPNSRQTNYEVLRASVIEAQAAVQDTSARGGTGETNGRTCKQEVTADTACLREVLEVHENYHGMRCTSERKDRRLGELENRFANKPLLDYVNEEIDAYQYEIDEALKRLRAIDGSCRPRGWVGTIRVTETRTMNITTTAPANPPYSDGTRRTMENEFRRWGTIVTGRKPSTAYWQAQDLTKSHETNTGMTGCSGGLKTKPPDRRFNNIVHQEASATGLSRVVPPVSIDVNAPTYTISFSIPSLQGEGVMTGYNKSSGGCDEFNIPTNAGPYPNEIPASDGIQATGTMKPKDTYVGGSQTFDLAPRSSASGVTHSHKLTVYWHLHKLE